MKIFWSILTIVILALGSLASAQEQAGQPCHNNKKDPLFGLYCPTINGSFVGPKNGSQLNTTTVINGVITPITGTLTFAPGPNVTPVVDDYDDSGNPICYQYGSNGNVTGTITCPSVASYDITQWDITIGAVHLVQNPLDPSVTNSSCGNGYSNSFKTDAGNSVYYICGANTDSASTGILVLIIPTSYFIGGPHHSYVNLTAEDQVTASDGTISFYDTGLYAPGITPNASTVGALDPPAKPKGKK
jgi:hypothetical protein